MGEVWSDPHPRFWGFPSSPAHTGDCGPMGRHRERRTPPTMCTVAFWKAAKVTGAS